MWMLVIPLATTAVAQTVLAIVCLLRYPRTRHPAILLMNLCLCYVVSAARGYESLATFYRASSFDPVGDWIDLRIQHVIVTGNLFAAACIANIWLAYSIRSSYKAQTVKHGSDGSDCVPRIRWNRKNEA